MSIYSDLLAHPCIDDHSFINPFDHTRPLIRSPLTSAGFPVVAFDVNEAAVKKLKDAHNTFKGNTE